MCAGQRGVLALAAGVGVLSFVVMDASFFSRYAARPSVWQPWMEVITQSLNDDQLFQ